MLYKIVNLMVLVRVTIAEYQCILYDLIARINVIAILNGQLTEVRMPVFSLKGIHTFLKTRFVDNLQIPQFQGHKN